MKKYVKWLIPISIIGMLLAGCQMNSESKSQSNEVKNSKQSAVKKGKKVIKKEQVAYLKKYEKELTEYVKTQNPDISEIKYDWNSVRIVEASNGTPQGGEQLLLIWSYANGSELTNFTLNFTLGDNQMPNIDSVGSDNLSTIED
ncbi:hypothetical protein [Streptococcus agalactiae]|uniref:Lipoprotein n=5 Tax=Streptococcus agalactiae TaxID=1311 RepID=A0A0H1UDC7_STRAG|nr:hypothetical protein [Streptococcus agalactiae]EPX16926.1 hypothetical protein SAG0169_09820 [Streptococcus agalactiae LDS 610]EPT34890.1 hypothetical protein SAG0021_00400 [Streptococcus agalactiae FSL S3-277]EPT39506.1 hypothetical protein SAG0030_03620 [Streptococcus agalactiae FSL S3-603]EPT42110.1 hypothetical protein SAG0024_10420 [Streptococcus agalactiae FSL C1-494]EPT44255.1 hypothetical protein SAG0034_03355 [Streptococcus agalactiae FSL S3-170]